MTSDSHGPSVDQIVAGILAKDCGSLARAITLIESTREADRARARSLIDAILPRSGGAVRVGISGVPGAGKSSLIDALGATLVEGGRHVAVLAVDPSSQRTQGSILGDKTRMPRLARAQRAFIRPTPGAGTPGGVAPRTREAVLLCEAAGYEVVMVETVGVGQAELEVAFMVDTLLLLVLAGAGDELQGIKRGVLELADVIALHKADGEGMPRALQARDGLESALRLWPAAEGGWRPPVLACSAHTGHGLPAVWEAICQHRDRLGPGGRADKRRRQAVHWFERCVEEDLRRAFFANPAAAARFEALRAEVRSGARSPLAAADDLRPPAGARAPRRP